MSSLPVLADPFAREVRAGLSDPRQKTLPCGYLYDAVGSALFDAITCLDEYGLTRADARILTTHAGDIAARMSGAVTVVELGSGSGAKTRPILEAFGRVSYFPIDVSDTALSKCCAELARCADIVPIHATYLEGLERAVDGRAGRILTLFLGSTIGNFENGAAVDFLYQVGWRLRAGDALLLGADLVQAPARMIAAYDDSAGVTAAFNRNLLSRINRELNANFDLRAFAHIARYNPAHQRIEMHLRSRARQTVRIEAARLTVEFSEGETILTEVCHKFLPDQIALMARESGFRVESQWQDHDWPFTESLLRKL